MTPNASLLRYIRTVFPEIASFSDDTVLCEYDRWLFSTEAHGEGFSEHVKEFLSRLEPLEASRNSVIEGE